MAFESLTERLRGQYAVGPHLPNGKPEFGFRQFEAPPIQHEAADEIQQLRAMLMSMINLFEDGPPNVSDEDCEAAVEQAREVLFGQMTDNTE